MKYLRVFLFSLLLGAAAFAATTDEQRHVQELYRRGLLGDKGAVEQCIAALESTLQREPSNQLARVYLGSAFTLRSRDLPLGGAKLTALRRGLALMDEAVAAAPAEPKVRLARALTNSALPGFLGRASSARADFALLARAAERTPERFDTADLRVIYYQAGLAAKTAGDRARAAAYFRQALRHEGDPALTAKLNAELSRLQ